VIIRRYRVAEEHQASFLRHYNDDGDWAALFRRDPAFKGARLLRDAQGGGAYLGIEYWESLTAYERFMRLNAAACAELDARCEALASERTLLGRYIHPA
jgi:heme-degrading monooxygenase HmoA